MSLPPAFSDCGGRSVKVRDQNSVKSAIRGCNSPVLRGLWKSILIGRGSVLARQGRRISLGGSMNILAAMQAQRRKLEAIRQTTECSWSLRVKCVFLAACQDGSASNQNAFPKSSEHRRVAASNGRFDAVLVTDLLRTCRAVGEGRRE